MTFFSFPLLSGLRSKFAGHVLAWTGPRGIPSGYHTNRCTRRINTNKEMLMLKQLLINATKAPTATAARRALSAATLVSSSDPIMVFGHKVPDTDTVCSAMVREWDLEQQGIPAQASDVTTLTRVLEFSTDGVPPLGASFR